MMEIENKEKRDLRLEGLDRDYFLKIAFKTAKPPMTIRAFLPRSQSVLTGSFSKFSFSSSAFSLAIPLIPPCSSYSSSMFSA